MTGIEIIGLTFLIAGLIGVVFHDRYRDYRINFSLN